MVLWGAGDARAGVDQHLGDACSACALPENGNARGVPPKGCRVVAQELEGEALIHRPVGAHGPVSRLRFEVLAGKETENTEPVIGSHNNCVFEE